MPRNRDKRPRLQIIRGLPGSGKTTLAVARYPHLLRVETDMYFSRGGCYVFDLELNRRSVAWFQDTVRTCTACKMDFVATGVFAAHTERLDKTVRLALINGYDVWIKTLTADYGNIHKVNPEHLESMRRAFVPDRELRKEYADEPHVHFGLMPNKLRV